MNLLTISKFLDYLITSNLDTKGDDELMVIVVDDLSKTYTEASKLPMQPSVSPFRQKTAEECFLMLQEFVENTGSAITDTETFAILDERSMKDKSVLVVRGDVRTGKFRTVRTAMEKVDMTLAALVVGSIGIEELQQSAAKEEDGVCR